jgi:hypothetical protein
LVYLRGLTNDNCTSSATASMDAGHTPAFELSCRSIHVSTSSGICHASTPPQPPVGVFFDSRITPYH